MIRNRLLRICAALFAGGLLACAPVAAALGAGAALCPAGSEAGCCCAAEDASAPVTHSCCGEPAPSQKQDSSQTCPAACKCAHSPALSALIDSAPVLAGPALPTAGFAEKTLFFRSLSSRPPSPPPRLG